LLENHQRGQVKIVGKKIIVVVKPEESLSDEEESSEDEKPKTAKVTLC